MVEDVHAFLFVEDFAEDQLCEIGVVGVGHQTHHFLVGDLCPDGQEILFEDEFIQVFQDLVVELQTLVEAFLLGLLDADEFGEETGALAIDCFDYLGSL